MHSTDFKSSPSPVSSISATHCTVLNIHGQFHSRYLDIPQTTGCQKLKQIDMLLHCCGKYSLHSGTHLSRELSAFCSTRPTNMISSTWWTSMMSVVNHILLIKFMIIYCHFPRSICHLHSPKRHNGWGCGRNHHSCIFQVLDGVTNLFSPSRDAALSWVTDSVRKGSSRGFHFALPIIKGLTPHSWIREPIWGLCQLLSYLFYL